MSTLTPRQEEVVALIASGIATSDKALADALGISTTAVRMRIQSIYEHTGTCERVGIVLWAVKRERRTARLASLTASPSDHREDCTCSVCYVHRVVEPREARERSRRVA